MKKGLIIALIALAVLGRTETVATDINQLEPVAAVQILSDQEGVWVLTDTGSSGYGESLDQALDNLHNAAPARIFLDTAQYLLVDKEEHLPELWNHLRPACRVCLANNPVDLELAADYLKVHDNEITLLQYLAEHQELPILYSKEGRSQLVP